MFMAMFIPMCREEEMFSSSLSGLERLSRSLLADSAPGCRGTCSSQGQNYFQMRTIATLSSLSSANPPTHIVPPAFTFCEVLQNVTKFNISERDPLWVREISTFPLRITFPVLSLQMSSLAFLPVILLLPVRPRLSQRPLVPG